MILMDSFRNALLRGSHAECIAKIYYRALCIVGDDDVTAVKPEKAHSGKVAFPMASHVALAMRREMSLMFITEQIRLRMAFETSTKRRSTL